MHFMKALLGFIDSLSNMNNVKNPQFQSKLKKIYFSNEILEYLERFSVYFNKNLRCNWFLKTEINFIFNLISRNCEILDKYVVKVAFNLLSCLSQDGVDKIFKILDKIVFNVKYYQQSLGTKEKTGEFDRWKSIYNGIVVSKLRKSVSISRFLNLNSLVSHNYLVFQNEGKYFAVNNWKHQILEESWPYSLLMMLLYNVETSTEEKKIVETGNWSSSGK